MNIWQLNLSISSVTQSCPTIWDPWTAAGQASLSITNSQSLLKLISIESVLPSNISSSVIPFSSCLQSFPASGSFPMSQFLAQGGQSIGVSASASVFPMNIQDLFPLGLTGWMSLQSKRLSRVFSNTKFKRINSLVLSFLYSPTLTFLWSRIPMDWNAKVGSQVTSRLTGQRQKVYTDFKSRNRNNSI